MQKMKRKNVIIFLAQSMWEYARGYRKWVVLYASMACIAILVSLLSPLVMAKLMKLVQTQSGDTLITGAGKYLALYVLIGVAFWLLHGPSRVIETVVSFIVKRALQMTLFHKITALPMKWHRDHHSGETIDQMAKASQALGDFTECGFEVIHLATRFIGAVAVLTWLMPWAGMAVITVGVFAAATIMLFDRKLVVQYTTLNKRFNEVAASIQDYLTNVATVISLRLEDRVAREVRERTDRILPLWRGNTVLNELKWFTTNKFVDFTHAGVLFGFIVVMVKSGRTIEIGMMYALSEYLRTIGESFYQFTSKYGDLVVKCARVRSVEHIEQAFDEQVRASDLARLPEGWRQIEVSGLTFVHDGVSDDERALGVRGVDITLERGKSYAFVGESGSGKSTVLKLLRGLIRPESAQVSVDGTVLPYGLHHVAHHTTLIPQDPEIFAETIRFNVGMGVAASDEQVRQALTLARFAAVLARLPRGLDTSIAEKGVSLSGGEKQRLAVARGLFFVRESNSELVLLDEPTSSVDGYNERLIYEGVLREFADRCVVTAIHKFNLLHLFDEVLVFANGRLVERGTVEELRERGAEFSRLWNTFANESTLRKVI